MHPSFSPESTVDLVTEGPGDEISLIIVHSGKSDSSRDEEDGLLQKLNSYLNFILDGEFERRYPQAKGRKLRLQIDSAFVPPDGIKGLIAQADEQLLERNIRVCFKLIE